MEYVVTALILSLGIGFVCYQLFRLLRNFDVTTGIVQDTSCESTQMSAGDGIGINLWKSTYLIKGKKYMETKHRNPFRPRIGSRRKVFIKDDEVIDYGFFIMLCTILIFLAIIVFFMILEFIS